MLNLDHFIKEYRDTIHRIIKVDWYRFSRDVDGIPIIDTKIDLLIPIISRREAEFIGKDKYGLMHLISVCEAIKNGPKLVKCSYERSIALLHTEIKVPLIDYRQPYPSIFVELDQRFIEYLAERYKRPVPKGVIIYHHPETHYTIFSILVRCQEFGSTISSMYADDDQMTIEDHLRRIVNKGENRNDDDLRMGKDVQRMIMNYMLLMTNYGVETRGYVDRKGRVRPSDGEMVWLGIEQHVKVFERRNLGTPGDGTHESPHPHWRRGHWRNQPYGTGFEKRRQVYIAPVFVCADRFGGDMTGTGVVYE